MSPTDRHMDKESLEKYRGTPIWCITERACSVWTKNVIPFAVIFVEFEIVNKNGIDFNEVTVKDSYCDRKSIVRTRDLFLNYQDALNAYFVYEINSLTEQVSSLKSRIRYSSED